MHQPSHPYQLHRTCLELAFYSLYTSSKGAQPFHFWPAGIPARPVVAPRPLRNIAEFCVNAMRTGILRDAQFLEEFQGDADILYARTLVEPGSKVSWVGLLGCSRPCWV